MEIVHIIYHHDPAAWWADSPEVPGWTATAKTLDELWGLAEQGVRFALERDDLLIQHDFDYEIPEHASIVFDFVAGRTIVSPSFTSDGSRRGARWDAQPA
jgi:hypothetical protein